MISHFFIDRPIFACVVCLVITLLGAVSMQSLPVEQFPDIIPPTIMVRATYPGASAEDVANTVAIPLEQQINGVDNMIYMTTSCTSDGTMEITVTFEVGMNPDIATVLVQNRVKIAEPLLPEEVRRLGVQVNKRSTNLIFFLNIHEDFDQVHHPAQPRTIQAKGGISGALEHAAREAEEGDDVKETKSGAYLANYASLYVKDRLARVKGVGEVMAFDNRLFSMRIWLDEDAMAARGISVQEVNRVIAEQNVQVPAGRIGLPPVPEGIQTNLAIVTLGRLEEASQFENIILRRDANGSILRLKDIALIELGAQSYTMECRFNGLSATGMAIAMRSGANALEVADAVEKTLEELRPNLKRSGLDYDVAFNVTSFIRTTVEEFYETLFLCVLFVVGTVFIFLQDWRAALIPTLTIPVSIVGTFFLMGQFGFSINTMTLFGLILVIGIVVDDAIVVVENTQRIIDEEGLEPHAAAKKSMNEVFGPVVATVLVMMAIFLPTAMMPGIVGILYKQFALTIAGAVGISGVCGITLAPALCAILLRPSIPKNRKAIPFRVFNFFFDGFAAFYLRTVKGMIRLSPLVLFGWFILIVVLVGVFKFLPKGFLPNEDQGAVFVDVKLPEGATQERTAEVLNRVEELLKENRKEELKLTGKVGVQHWMLVNGFSFIGGSGSNLGIGILPLAPWSQRREPQLQLQAIVGRLEKAFATIPEAEIRPIVLPPIQIGMSNGVSYQLIDERGVTPEVLYQVMEEVKAKAMTVGPGDEMWGIFPVPVSSIVAALTPFNPNAPRLYLDIDRDKAQKMGLSLTEVFAALQTNIGSAYINDFNKFSRTFRVYVQAMGIYRQNPNDILNMKVKNTNGQMVPLSAFVTIKEVSGPQLLTRYNLFPSAALTGIVRGDKSTGEAIAKMEAIDLPDGFNYDWTGLSYQEKQVGSQTLMIFAMALVFGFLILAAQYESWSTPLIIMMAVPLGVAGALTAVIVSGFIHGKMEINLYTQIGLVLMIGLSAKNAILITEFARERRHQGTPLVEAAYQAGRLRLRPIMMTSFAFILGVLPLVLAKGAGANSRHAIGSCVFGGLLMETMVGVYVSPVLFVLMQGVSEWCEKHINAGLEYSRKKAERRAEEEDEAMIRRGD